jgi:hypothetical protein
MQTTPSLRGFADGGIRERKNTIWVSTSCEPRLVVILVKIAMLVKAVILANVVILVEVVVLLKVVILVKVVMLVNVVIPRFFRIPHGLSKN